MANLVEIEFKLPDLAAKLKKYEKRIQLSIAASMQTNRAFLFDAGGAINGHEAWKPLKYRDGVPLSDKGTLRKSLVSGQDGSVGTDGIVQFGSGEVTIGTKIFYAAINNYGGVIKHPGTEKGFGRGIKIKPYDINIPKRNFSDLNDQDREELQETFNNLIINFLNKEE